MNVILDLSPGTCHCSCFRLRKQTYQSWQSARHYILSTKYDLDLSRLQPYVDKMASITTLPSNPLEPKQSFFSPWDSYASRWIIQKVDPNYDAYWRQKWPIKCYIGHKCVCVYGVGCRIVALKSWYLYFLPDTPVCRRPRLVWWWEWNVTESPRFIHSSQPIGHGLVSILVQDLHARS